MSVSRDKKLEQATADGLTALGLIFFEPWGLMLGLGILHHHGAAVPAVGYWTSFALSLCMGVVATSYTWSLRKQIKRDLDG